MAATGHMWLLNPLNVASAAEGQKLKLHLILIYLTLCSHMWLLATVLDSVAPELFHNLHEKEFNVWFLLRLTY